jgi:hypothetical protein
VIPLGLPLAVENRLENPLPVASRTDDDLFQRYPRMTSALKKCCSEITLAGAATLGNLADRNYIAGCEGLTTREHDAGRLILAGLKHRR